MENKMETTTVYWSYNGVVERKMETTIVSRGMIDVLVFGTSSQERHWAWCDALVFTHVLCAPAVRWQRNLSKTCEA